MKNVLILILLVTSIIGCKSNKKAPDITHIPIKITVERFEQDLFAKDGKPINQKMDLLSKKYGAFFNDFLYNILALAPQQDSTMQGLAKFIEVYQPIYDSTQVLYGKQIPIREVTEGLQYIKYYFPTYAIPNKIITYVGPIEGYGTVLTTSGLAVGLQMYLGANFSVYQTDYIREIYPSYQSNRFDKNYLAVNCINNILEDIEPTNIAGKPLIEQMIELGKKQYILQACLPNTANHLLYGYTEQQLAGCEKNEAYIWNFFLQNDLLYKKDPLLVRDYVNDGPKTEALGDASPGNIGKFIGHKIVNKWMQQQKEASMNTLLATEASTIFTEAKYKPK